MCLWVCANEYSVHRGQHGALDPLVLEVQVVVVVGQGTENQTELLFKNSTAKPSLQPLVSIFKKTVQLILTTTFKSNNTITVSTSQMETEKLTTLTKVTD